MAGPPKSLLIRGAEVYGHGRADILIEGERIARIGRDLDAGFTARVVEASGQVLLPGLHDHHIHLAGLAARRQSVWCGPPEVCNEGQLADCLVSAPGTGWIRGIGYHESVLGGLPGAAKLDRLMPDRPLRLQHRSGRMWLFNSAALELLLASAEPPPGLERDGGHFTGRLFDADAWLREALGSQPPDLADISRELARHGVTGITDMTPQNDPAMAEHFAAQRQSAALLQSLTLAGTLKLSEAATAGWTLGPVKLHLHEADLPDFEHAVNLAHAAHEQGRPLAVHCVTEVELVFTLAVLEEAGAIAGDRIEHASIASPDHIARIAQMGLAVCVQPHFVAERGDRYLIDVEPRLHGDLYRLESLHRAGIALAGGSDAPFGQSDPWAAMRAAVSRRTAAGAALGPDEALTPEQALALWLADPVDLTRQRSICEGARADLCLLDRSWTQARECLASEQVQLTVTSGQIVHDRIDEPPFQRPPR
jgi:predicted amidohydrolase YtcJ